MQHVVLRLKETMNQRRESAARDDESAGVITLLSTQDYTAAQSFINYQDDSNKGMYSF
jgi:hypothetical protein